MAEKPTEAAGSAENEPALSLPFGLARSQAVQRLQIGLFGLAAMILIVALANVIMDRAMESDATTVPEAAATVAADPPRSPVNDPLIDAGVVPDMPAVTATSSPAAKTPAANDGNGPRKP